jgi:hypothetical protein
MLTYSYMRLLARAGADAAESAGKGGVAVA